MPCILAFIVLAIMSVFSLTYRQLAKEAWDCVFKRITLRPCTTGFKEKIKASLTAKLLVKSPFLAKIVNRYYELLAWIIAILSIVSIFWFVRGLINYYFYGSCNGLNDTGVCLLDLSGEHNAVSACDNQANPAQTVEKLSTANTNWQLFAQSNPESKKQIIFIGCVNCHYSRSAYDDLWQLAQDNQANFIFAHYPAKIETDYLTTVLDCAWEQNQVAYWQFLSQMFHNDPQINASASAIIHQATLLGFDQEALTTCTHSSQESDRRFMLHQEVAKTNLYGTPLVFINGTALIGPKPFRVYRHALLSASNK